jgi:hypothetical protein
MTQAVVAIQNGFKFQARHFWLTAAALLDPGQAAVKVGFECGPKSFDDVWIEYAPGRGPRGPDRIEVRKMHYQCKWHESPGLFGHADFANPEFIGASARSFLGRAHDALRNFDDPAYGVGFSLVTNWRPNPSDKLSGLICNRTAAFRIEKMFEGGGISKTGQLRLSWQEHLGIDEQELRRLVGSLRIEQATDSLEKLRENLGYRLELVGLRRIPAEESAFPYDAIAYEWLGQRKTIFDRETFRKMCREENLFTDERKPRAAIFGVKSFVHRLDVLENRCDDVLDLTACFHDRQIITETSWVEDVYPRMRDFLQSAAKGEPRLRLALDAHLSLAFVAGSILDVKCGRTIELAQRTQSGQQIWSADDAEASSASASLDVAVVDLATEGTELAVLIELTHDIEADVRAFVGGAAPSVAHLLILKPTGGPGQQSVLNGRHACDLADSVVRAVRSTRTTYNARGPLHLFIASPASFAFFLGQRSASLGRVALYEYDFEQLNGGSYVRSIDLPVGSKV